MRITLVTAPGAQATAISPEVGGAFTLFGGYITGRHLEMLPGERLVQAWRAGGWNAGEYSVVRFSLAAQGSGCKLLFDHRWFPARSGSESRLWMARALLGATGEVSAPGLKGADCGGRQLRRLRGWPRRKT